MHAMGAYFAVTLFAPHMIMIMAARWALHYSLALLQIVVFHKRHSPLYPLIMALPHLGHLMLEHGDPGWWGALAPQPGQTQFPPGPAPALVPPILPRPAPPPRPPPLPVPGPLPSGGPLPSFAGIRTPPAYYSWLLGTRYLFRSSSCRLDSRALLQTVMCLHGGL